MLRGLRGAILVKENKKDEIILATTKLLKALIKENKIEIVDIASIIFTNTKDLNSVFPAEAARKIGLTGVPLLCAQEIEVANSLKSVVRILIHFNTDKLQNEVKHIYLDGAEVLRTDLV